MKSIIKYFEDKHDRMAVTLCFSQDESQNSLIHILHRDRGSSVCGSITGMNNCVFTRRIFIKVLLETMIYNLEVIKNSTRIDSFWNFIQKDRDVHENIASLILSGLEEQVYDDCYDELHNFEYLKNARPCKTCIGIFIGALFMTGKKVTINDSLKQHWSTG